jgi:hypothetical protein
MVLSPLICDLFRDSLSKIDVAPTRALVHGSPYRDPQITLWCVWAAAFSHTIISANLHTVTMA